MQLTRLRYGHHVRDVGHKDASLELEWPIPAPGLWPERFSPVPLVLEPGRVHLLAAKEDALKQVYLVLSGLVLNRISSRETYILLLITPSCYYSMHSMK